MSILNRMSCLPKCFGVRRFRSPPISWENTIPFKPPITGGIVIKVYDGDTITIASKLPYKSSPLYRWSVRIKGIDCPEMKTKNKNEKMVAEIAQCKLENMILHKNVKLENVSNDKYGRVLADVVYRKTSIGEFMIKNRLAVEYFGKTKEPPKDWLKFYNSEYHPKKEKVRRDVLNTRIVLNQAALKKGMTYMYETDVEIVV